MLTSHTSVGSQKVSSVDGIALSGKPFRANGSKGPYSKSPMKECLQQAGASAPASSSVTTANKTSGSTNSSWFPDPACRARLEFKFAFYIAALATASWMAGSRSRRTRIRWDHRGFDFEDMARSSRGACRSFIGYQANDEAPDFEPEVVALAAILNTFVVLSGSAAISNRWHDGLVPHFAASTFDSDFTRALNLWEPITLKGAGEKITRKIWRATLSMLEREQVLSAVEELAHIVLRGNELDNNSGWLDDWLGSRLSQSVQVSTNLLKAGCTAVARAHLVKLRASQA